MIIEDVCPPGRIAEGAQDLQALLSRHGFLPRVAGHDGISLKSFKSAPPIEDVAGHCIECGFCEAVCPSRNITTTPRQRIVLRREMARQPPSGGRSWRSSPARRWEPRTSSSAPLASGPDLLRHRR
jgi:ferredoxin